MNIYILKELIDEHINTHKSLYLRFTDKPCPEWMNNHELLIANYTKMKESRYRIIKQRDMLQRQVNHLNKVVNQLDQYRLLKSENNDLYTTVQGQNAEIMRLKNIIEQNRTESFELKRDHGILKAKLKQIMEDLR